MDRQSEWINRQLQLLHTDRWYFVTILSITDFSFPSELTCALCIFKIVCYHVISWNTQSVTQFFYYFLVLKTSKNNSTEQLKSDKMLHDRYAQVLVDMLQWAGDATFRDLDIPNTKQAQETAKHCAKFG